MKQMQQNDPAAGQQTQPEKGSEAAAAPEQKEKKTLGLQEAHCGGQMPP